jgi:hypothetical protein
METMIDADVRKLLWLNLPVGYTEDLFTGRTRRKNGMEKGYCQLCQRRVKIIRTHCQESQEHIQRAQILVGYRMNANANVARLLGNAARLAPRVKQLGRAPWKARMRRLLAVHPDRVPFRKRVPPPAKIAVTLATYEARDRLAFLELAAWKMVVFTERAPPPQDAIAPFAFANSENRWKAHKKEYRRHASIGIIVRGVLPFVDIYM